jgi:hypothetical protein
MIREKYVRAEGQWVKITRHTDKSFTIARGYKGEVKAHDVHTYSSKWLPTWKRAIEHAELQIEMYK